MDVGAGRWVHQGSVHRVPVPDVDGAMYLCGLEVIGPDPMALVNHVGADTVVALQEDDEILRRYPDYLAWLSDAPITVLRLPTPDYLVVDDDQLQKLADQCLSQLRDGSSLVVHCGAGWGRAGVLAVAIMMQAGQDLPDALATLRAARPAAGPQSPEQTQQLERLA